MIFIELKSDKLKILSTTIVNVTAGGKEKEMEKSTANDRERGEVHVNRETSDWHEASNYIKSHLISRLYRFKMMLFRVAKRLFCT